MNLYEKYVFGVVVVIVLINAFLYNHRKSLNQTVHRVFKKDKAQGTLLFIIISSVVTLFLAPTTPFNILALYLYEPVRAFIIVMIFHLISGVIAFYIARSYEPEALKRRLEDIEIYKLLTSKENLSFLEWTLLCFLTRASMNFPFSVLSYAWGFTKIPFEAYLIGTLGGVIIPVLLELYLLHNMGEMLEGKGTKHIVISILITVITIYVMARIIDSHLKKQKHLHPNKLIKGTNSASKRKMSEVLVPTT